MLVANRDESKAPTMPVFTPIFVIYILLSSASQGVHDSLLKGLFIQSNFTILSEISTISF